MECTVCNTLTSFSNIEKCDLCHMGACLHHVITFNKRANWCVVCRNCAYVVKGKYYEQFGSDVCACDAHDAEKAKRTYIATNNN